MRIHNLLTGLMLLVSAAGVAANEPLPPAQPLVLTAMATTDIDGCVVLHIRMVEMQQDVQEIISQIPIREVTIVNGRVIERNRMIEERRQVPVLRAVPGRVIEVPLMGGEVGVFEMKGKPVLPKDVANRLKKEQHVLVSVSGPVDPYFLQTTKGGTLIIQMPAQLLYPAAAAPTKELLPPPKVDSGEPPLAPPTRSGGERIVQRKP